MSSGLDDVNPAAGDKTAPALLRRPGSWPLLPAVGLLILTLCVAAPFFDVPMQRDQGVYAACGSLLLHGGAPYRDCWDTKAPLTHYTYALAQILFGIDLKGPVIVSAAMVGLTGLVLWRIARRWFGPAPAWSAGLLYALLVVSIPFDMNAQSEGFANLFIALGVWAALAGAERENAWALAAAGAALAVAVGYKYTILLPAGAAIAGALWTGLRTPGRAPARPGGWLWWLLPLALGLVGALGAAGLYLWARGALGLASEHVVFMLTEFPKVAVNPTLLLFPGESGPPLFYVQRTWLQLMRLPVVHLLGLAGCGLALWRRRAWGWLLLVWLSAALVSVYPQKVMTLYHWTPSLAPLALGAGAALWEMGAMPRSRLALAVALAALLANLGVRFYEDQWLIVARHVTGQQTRDEFYASQAIQDELEVAAYVRDRTEPHDLIWVWGNHSIIYYWSDRQSPTRFIFNSPLMAEIGPNEFQPRWKAEVLEALHTRPPTFIVMTWWDRTWFDYENPADQFPKQPGFQEFLDRYYRPEIGIGRFVLHRLIPWWSRHHYPDLLPAVTETDLLEALGSARLVSAPGQPIVAAEFKLHQEPAYPVMLMHPEASASYSLALPTGSPCFRADLAMAPESWGWGGDGATFALSVNGEPVFEQTVGNAVEDRFWQPALVDLSRWAGQTITLTLATGPGPAADFTGDLAGWGLPRIVRSPGESCAARAIVR